jgi:REP element-mobilizing transposase RayT
MVNNPEIHRRNTIRLHGVDYSLPGAYFITTNVQDRLSVLSSITNDQAILTDFGRIVTGVWTGLPDHYPQVEIDEYVVMPDHFHGILRLYESNKPYSKSEIVRGFKTFSAKQINILTGRLGQGFWQRNFYEHVIRGDDDLNRIRQYIQEKPLKWQGGSGDISPSVYFK